MNPSGNIVRIAAVADIHYTSTHRGAFQPLFEETGGRADVHLLSGNLTDTGRPEETRVLVRDLTAAMRIPAMGVLGKHDHESGRQEELKEISERVGKPSGSPAALPRHAALPDPIPPRHRGMEIRRCTGAQERSVMIGEILPKGAKIMRRKMLPGLCWAAVAFFLLFCSRSFGFDTETSRETLKGVRRILPAVNFMSEDCKKHGIHMSALQFSMEQKLRNAGIEIPSPGNPYHDGVLSVNVICYEFEKEYLIFNISEYFLQDVIVVRNVKLAAQVPTWTTETVGHTTIGQPEFVEEKVNDAIDRFVNAYRSVNPEK
jgi:hypothetical protein